MTSKKLGAILRSVPPATALAEEPALPMPTPTPATTAPEPLPDAPMPMVPAAPPLAKAEPEKERMVPSLAAAEREVPLQVLIPAGVRKQLALYCATHGESLRSVMLQAIRGLGIEVTEADIKGKRGRKNY